MQPRVVTEIRLGKEHGRPIVETHRQRKIGYAASVGHELAWRGLGVDRGTSMLKLVLLRILRIVAPVVARPYLRVCGREHKSACLVIHGDFTVDIRDKSIGDAVIPRDEFHAGFATVERK